jgi:hypothetical protein
VVVDVPVKFIERRQKKAHGGRYVIEGSRHKL